MNYSKIYTCDICDGPGIRVGFYTQGCTNKCPGCFNPESWDINGGRHWTATVTDDVIKLLRKDYYSGLSILGGDPFCAYHYLDDGKDSDQLLRLVLKFRNEFGGKKDIWMWTGYTWEEIMENQYGSRFSDRCRKILRYVDVLVDGRYEKGNTEGKHIYRGSNNQRVIDVQKSLYDGNITLFCK